MENIATSNGVTLTQKEAEEYCAYKRQKKISEITSAMRRSESVFVEHSDNAKLLEQSGRLHQSALRVTPNQLFRYREELTKCGVPIDCVIGGSGETLAKVKGYEAKTALRLGAKEITLVLSPSALSQSRYIELRKELKFVKRRVGKHPIKARVERSFPQAILSRVARICSELKIHLSIPYFEGCERILADLSCGCFLEVSGVDTLADFQKTIGAGMGRIITTRAWELYSEWLKEADKITLESLPKATPIIKELPKVIALPAPQKA